MLAHTKMRAQVLSATVPAHRMCQTLHIVFTFWEADLCQDEGSRTVPALRMCQTLLKVSHLWMLPYTQIRDQVLSNTVPAHRMCQTLLVDFTFCDAGLHPEEGPSALKYRACAQIVPDVTRRFYILRCWFTAG